MITQHRGVNIILAIVGFILFLYVFYQILVFIEAPTKYLFEYLMFFVAMGVLYLLMPSDITSWK